jgi:predicted RNA-binding Zn-ribbon protein involved in translation (DUF1610 family)
MGELISQKAVVAKKPHRCDFCRREIHPGETYVYSFIKDGISYSWRSHLKCDYISQALWEYIDPWDGIGAEEFLDGCAQFSTEFVCPNCPYFNHEFGICKETDCRDYCVDKLYDFLCTHQLRKATVRDGWAWKWEVVEMKGDTTDEKSD